MTVTFHKDRIECAGELSLLCESCNGERIVRSEDTPAERCRDCGGSGLDADALVVGGSLYAWANSVQRRRLRG